MPRYKKRSASFDAFQWDGLPTGRPQNPGWVRQLGGRGKIAPRPNVLVIKTPRGNMRVNVDDWITRDDDGKILVVKDADFSTEYEEDE